MNKIAQLEFLARYMDDCNCPRLADAISFRMLQRVAMHPSNWLKEVRDYDSKLIPGAYDLDMPHDAYQREVKDTQNFDTAHYNKMSQEEILAEEFGPEAAKRHVEDYHDDQGVFFRGCPICESSYKYGGEGQLVDPD
jgi:hypothetical protein